MSTGCLLGALSVLVGIPILICGGCFIVGDSLRKASDRGDEGPIVITELNEEVRVDDMGVTVQSAKVVGFSSVTAGGRQMFHNPEFVVRLKLKNYNSNRVIDAGAQSGVAKLTDDIGNDYKELLATNEFGLNNTIDGQIPDGHVRPVRSDADGQDVIVFSRPVPGASKVDLLLDATKYGGSGKIKVTIMKAAWLP